MGKSARKMPKWLELGQRDTVPLTLFFAGIPGYIPYGRETAIHNTRTAFAFT